MDKVLSLINLTLLFGIQGKKFNHLVVDLIRQKCEVFVKMGKR